ncbi:uncharacterized protein FIESC28_00435 [Fusarium coffeatum]|uniref:Uncharacterized protein n=1 Tax=Fusarium coffeatum TaxID=231269 RepID=A0A366SC02_9HYPO|nr:uncharacterized protein FIESC28_00435 [Fusarium coffeatum]RBR26854.1 hypothetical protein FIESC28_00435 [Fusarium coffeatum]
MAWLTRYERLLQRARQLINFHKKHAQDPTNERFLLAKAISDPALLAAEFLARETEPLQDEAEYPPAWETGLRSLSIILRNFEETVKHEEWYENWEDERVAVLKMANAIHREARLMEAEAEVEAKKMMEEEAEANGRKMRKTAIERAAQLIDADLQAKTKTPSKKRKAEVEVPATDRVLRPRRK